MLFRDVSCTDGEKRRGSKVSERDRAVNSESGGGGSLSIEMP